jgi:hypothetical protein
MLGRVSSLTAFTAPSRVSGLTPREYSFALSLTGCKSTKCAKLERFREAHQTGCKNDSKFTRNLSMPENLQFTGGRRRQKWHKSKKSKVLFAKIPAVCVTLLTPVRFCFENKLRHQKSGRGFRGLRRFRGRLYSRRMTIREIRICFDPLFSCVPGCALGPWITVPKKCRRADVPPAKAGNLSS